MNTGQTNAVSSLDTDNLETLETSDKTISRMLSAVMAAKTAKTTRELIRARLKIHEAAIREMLESGVSQATILGCLASAMPSIPKKEIQAALEAIRSRMLRDRKKQPSKPSPQKPDSASQ